MNFDSGRGRFGIFAQRVIFGMALCGMLLSALTLPAYAALTGTINGTVTDPKNVPLAGVKVTAVSPTDQQSATTDAKGFFSMTGLQPDTYTVSYELQGFEPGSTTGVTVSAEQIVNLTETLSKTLTEIGRVAAHSRGSAFQPNQTTDTYTVTNQQIIESQGKDNANNEVTLVGSLPGAETDADGYPSLRGGRENEIGFEFEGINYDEPYSNQFSNSLLLNGVGSLQLSPGAGDASQGNSGTGVINLIAKRGTYPGFGMISGEDASQTFWHDFIAEYGFATPSGSFSNYFKYIGQRQGELYGNHNNNLAEIGEYDGNSFNTVDDFVDNMVFKFGKNKAQSIQLFYEGQNVQYAVGAAIPAGQTYYRTGDIGALTEIADDFYNAGLGTTFTPSQIASIEALYPGQTSQNEVLNDTPSYNQPNQAFKIQYNDNPDSSSYYNLRFVRTSSVTTFDFPTTIPAPGDYASYQILQGGLRTSGAFDYNRQLNSKNQLSIGAHDDYDVPVYSFYFPAGGLFNTSGAAGYLSSGQGFEILDFLPAGPTCPSGTFGGSCGYLYNPAFAKYFPNGVPRVPASDTYEPYQRHEYGAYVKDDVQFNEKLRFSAGLRLDGSSYNFGNLEQQFGIPNGTSDEVHPNILQPRLGASYLLTKHDSVAASYGRSIQNPYFSSSVNVQNPAQFNQFVNIPAYNNLTGQTGTAVTLCGVNANLPCKNYAQQLFWEYQNSTGIPVFTVKPEQFLNFDFSYSHEFPDGFAAKVTPFYRKGEDILVTTNPILGEVNGTPRTGPASTTNDGIERTSGVEFLLTRGAEYGFSGQLTATYINEFSNVPPLSADEDAFPTITPQSLALGNVYRVGFLSPFVSQLSLEYKSRGGIRINPVIQYTRGYPYNQGSLAPVIIPGYGYANVPNTNLTAPNGSNQAPCYVDVSNPGSLLNPNIVACRGTADTPSAGGILSNARFDTDLTIEYSPPKSRLLFGVQFLGLFNNLISYPTQNDCYQPVAFGVSGAASGTGACSYSNYPYGNGYNGYTNIRGGSPYLLIPNNNYSFTAQTSQTPLLTLFYVQVKL
jgi:hypothetical protein